MLAPGIKFLDGAPRSRLEIMDELPISDAEQIRLMRAALAEAQRGLDDGEAPLGCVIALPDPDKPGSTLIVARGYNRANGLQRSTAHAEMIAFENAGGDGHGRAPALPPDATNAILVSTLEPCVMCLGAAMEAGIALVLFGLQAPADNGTQRVQPPQSPESKVPQIVGGILAAESRHLFETWLAGNRGTEQAKFVEQLLALT